MASGCGGTPTVRPRPPHYEDSCACAKCEKKSPSPWYRPPPPPPPRGPSPRADRATFNAGVTSGASPSPDQLSPPNSGRPRAAVENRAVDTKCAKTRFLSTPPIPLRCENPCRASQQPVSTPPHHLRLLFLPVAPARSCRRWPSARYVDAHGRPITLLSPVEPHGPAVGSRAHFRSGPRHRGNAAIAAPTAEVHYSPPFPQRQAVARPQIRKMSGHDPVQAEGE